MTATRKPSTRKALTRDDLAPLARAALGPHRALSFVTRLRGGTKKGVYRLAFDDDSTAVAYVWSPDEDYWDADPPDLRDPFSHGTGLDLFTAAHDRLAAAGVRTPRLLHADAGHTHLPADAAIVEDLTGGSLEEALQRDPRTATTALERLAEQLTALPAHRGPAFGKVALVDNGGTPSAGSCQQRVTDGALRSIGTIAARDPRAAAREQLTDRIRTLAAAVRPRTGTHPLIHGELGPDHVLLTADGHPALIDRGSLCSTSTWSTNTSSSGSASARTTTPCAPPARTRTGCASTAWPCTWAWSPAPSPSSTATSRIRNRCGRSRSTTWRRPWPW